ncbi:4-hydroxybenzoate octaprenyltransferase [Rothia nasimurium]|uniref:4-hydroxybenzoate octaprenyltransferase n=1 Tax=Luteibacter anthropi TaxID=564369 RepID=A0A7X5UCS4_9GAMM|nr:4-hydroxybenzoate octaprenyltransferase [Luteibacter anthropi]
MSPAPKKPAPRRKAAPSARKTATAAPAVRPADASTRAERVLAFLLRGMAPGRRDKLYAYLQLTRMDRPIGALLLLWPTWWALWLAARDFPPVGPLVIFTLGVFAMRAAGCAINDYADRKLDPLVARTAGRPIASGRVTPREALYVFAGLLVFAFVLVLFTNRLTILLSFAGAALAAAYPFTKRYTHLPQVVLGAAFGWSIPMAFAAVSNNVPPVAWLLFIANIIWSVVYDTEYAMVDRDDDIKAGAKSTAILFADADLVIIGILMATFLLAMLLVGTRSGLGWPYWIGLCATAGLFGYQQWIMRERARDACLTAFRHNNWVGLALWVGIVLALAL